MRAKSWGERLSFHDVTEFIDSEVGRALVNLDSAGRLTPRGARIVRRYLAQTRSAGRSITWEPEQLLGSFDRLPPRVQEEIVEMIERAERWRLRGRELGKWHPRMARLVGHLRSLRIARKLSPLSEALVRGGPRRLLYGAFKLAARFRGKLSRRPSVGSLLHHAGVDPRGLAVCYVRGLAQPVGYQGFWHDEERNLTVGSVLGIDLIPSPQGYWYVESNLDAGLERELSALYGRDPFVTNLLDVARSGGHDHLVVMAPNYSAVNDLTARQFKEEAAALGIQLTILEDVFLKNGGFPTRDRLPKLEKKRTLIARLKFYNTNLDYLFDHKAGSYRALRLYQEHTGDSEFLLPNTSTDPRVSPCELAEPFPNFVYKLPERDAGTGVFFVKASSTEQASRCIAETIRAGRPTGLMSRLYAAQEDRNGLYQRYVKGSLLGDRRLYKIRAHVLLTPLGTRFLSAHRVVASRPVPEDLPLGIVRDPTPYLVNYSRGGRYAILPAEEQVHATRAALGVAKGLAWAAIQGFQTAPPGSSRIERS